MFRSLRMTIATLALLGLLTQHVSADYLESR